MTHIARPMNTRSIERRRAFGKGLEAARWIDYDGACDTWSMRV
jgi:hypothetical protein